MILENVVSSQKAVTKMLVPPQSVHGPQQSRKRSRDESSHCVSRVLGLKVCSERVPVFDREMAVNDKICSESMSQSHCVSMFLWTIASGA